MTNPAEPVLATTSIQIPLPQPIRTHGPSLPVTPDSASGDVMVSRNGEVRLRGRRRIHPLFGWVRRDPENPKRWVATNKRGLPVGQKTSTRAEALDQLTDYIDHTLLETVPVTEHISVATGPVTVVPEVVAPQRVRTVAERAVEIGVGLIALVPLALLIWGIPQIS